MSRLPTKKVRYRKDGPEGKKAAEYGDFIINASDYDENLHESASISRTALDLSALGDEGEVPGDTPETGDPETGASTSDET